jgi:Domain of unknown function (DUF309)
MMAPPFTSGNLPMPQWAYVPGETAEADADYETLAQAKLLVPPRFRGYVPARHPALRYGLALNDRGYFWESQEILEAVWAAAPQGGRERILLRACILIATANLRLRMQKPHAAARLLGEVLQELHALSARQATAAGDGFADGFRPQHWSSCSRAGWTSHCCPRPIGWKSAPSAEHETKCIFWRSGLDYFRNMHYSS